MNELNYSKFKISQKFLLTKVTARIEILKRFEMCYRQVTKRSQLLHSLASLRKTKMVMNLSISSVSSLSCLYLDLKHTLH